MPWSQPPRAVSPLRRPWNLYRRALRQRQFVHFGGSLGRRGFLLLIFILKIGKLPRTANGLLVRVALGLFFLSLLSPLLYDGRSLGQPGQLAKEVAHDVVRLSRPFEEAVAQQFLRRRPFLGILLKTDFHQITQCVGEAGLVLVAVQRGGRVAERQQEDLHRRMLRQRGLSLSQLGRRDAKGPDIGAVGVALYLFHHLGCHPTGGTHKGLAVLPPAAVLD
mmetsp:Transcript_30918/g.86621  ORF Transcript_30918/g.86621 Transcript_30918/m.86621 type:complete len:220 (-) Transcript_30918:491-1150(-)